MLVLGSTGIRVQGGGVMLPCHVTGRGMSANGCACALGHCRHGNGLAHIAMQCHRDIEQPATR